MLEGGDYIYPLLFFYALEVFLKSPEVNAVFIDDLVEIGGKDWFAWLKDNRCFRYKNSQTGNFSAFKRTRDEEYWYAKKKVRCKTRQIYMGKSCDLTSDLLWKTAELINASDTVWGEFKKRRKSSIVSRLPEEIGILPCYRKYGSNGEEYVSCKALLELGVKVKWL